ncbi:MAG: MarR family transcriptional regulator [Myxococcota bacterium]
MPKSINISARALPLVNACRALYASIDALDHTAATRVSLSRNDLRALNLLEHGPVRAGQIADALALTSGAVSTLIDRIESRGLASRIADPSDRRAILVAPTPKLFEEVGKIYLHVARRLAELAERYSDEELEQSLKLIGEITAAYDAASDSEAR